MDSDVKLSNATLHDYKGEFEVKDESDNIFKVRWEKEPTRVSKNPAGISGWAACDGKSKRLHVCFNDPCTARYPASKYGHVGPPTHVRLITTAPVAATEKSTGEGGAASSGASAEPPIVPVIAEMTAASPEPAPTTEPQTPAVAGPGAESKPVEEIAASQSADMSQGTPPPTLAHMSLDKSQVAPPPPLPPKSSGELAEVVPPPERATLLPLPSAAPCPPTAELWAAGGPVPAAS